MAAPPRSRRADILSAAEREFGAAGFAGARIERIAEAARVNKQLLFHYFGSKEGLFAVALAGLLAPLDPPPSGAASPADELRAVLGSLQQAARERPGLAGIAAAARANADFPEEALSVVRGWISRLQERVASALSEGQSRGYFRDDIDPVAVADLAIAAAIGSATLEQRGASPSVSVFVLDHCAWR
ncbi:MAG: TetR/AcrR family transcriptional regulator [Gemmatimonadales bacterium]